MASTGALSGSSAPAGRGFFGLAAPLSSRSNRRSRRASPTSSACSATRPAGWWPAAARRRSRRAGVYLRPGRIDRDGPARGQPRQAPGAGRLLTAPARPGADGLAAPIGRPSATATARPSSSSTWRSGPVEGPRPRAGRHGARRGDADDLDFRAPARGRVRRALPDRPQQSLFLPDAPRGPPQLGLPRPQARRPTRHKDRGPDQRFALRLPRPDPAPSRRPPTSRSTTNWLSAATSPAATAFPQLFFRPQLVPPSTRESLHLLLVHAAGAGVHGMCGYHAAPSPSRAGSADAGSAIPALHALLRARGSACKVPPPRLGQGRLSRLTGAG